MKTILAAAAIAVGLSAGQTNATCTQHDIGGTWEFYGDASGPLFSFDQALRCILHVNKLTGAIEQSSSCAAAGIGGGVSAPGTINSGTATLTGTENCTFNLSFHTNINGRILPVSAAHATMSLNKDLVAGLVSVEMGGTTFTMVKIR
jgi:hypothetical protein